MEGPLGHKRSACMLLFVFLRGGLFYSLPLRVRGRSSCSAKASYGSRAFLFIVLKSAQHPQIPRFLQIFRGIWPMPLSLLNHSALALLVQRTRVPTSARSTGFCAIWVFSSSSSSRGWLWHLSAAQELPGLSEITTSSIRVEFLQLHANLFSKGKHFHVFQWPYIGELKTTNLCQMRCWPNEEEIRVLLTTTVLRSVSFK